MTGNDADPARDQQDRPALRAALADLAEDAPLALDRQDLWNAGRRSTPRVDAPTVLLSLAVAASVLLCAFVAWTAVGATRTVEPATQNPDGALPTRLHAVPERLTVRGADGEFGEHVTRDLAVGQGSVAWVDPRGVPVLVDAVDGTQHLLALPGWDEQKGRGLDRGVLSLSPDGWHLAYGWAEPARSTTDTEAGLAVLDLRTGQVRRGTLTGRNDRALMLSTIRWSTNGQWLAWSADEPVEWTDSSASVRGPVTYSGADPVDELPAGKMEPRRNQSRTGGAVTDDQGLGWRGGNPGESLALGLASISPDGEYLATGGDRWLVRTTDGTLSQLRHPTARGDKEPLGWTSARSFVGVANRAGSASLQMTELRVDGDQVTEGPVLLTWKLPRDGMHVSVATDLVSHGTEDFDDPRWPWSTERRVATAALGVLALLLGAGAGIGLRRRRRQTLP